MSKSEKGPAAPADPSSPAPDPDARELQRVGDRVAIYRDPCKSRFWYVQYNLHGRQHRHSLKTTKKKSALDLARKKDAQLILGQAAPPDAKPITVAEAGRQNLEACRAKGLAPASLVGYRAKVAVLTAFCDRRHVRYLKDVTATILEAYQTALQTSGVVPPGPPRAGKRGSPFKSVGNRPRTVRDKMKIARQLIKWALKRRLLTVDPASGYDLPPAVKGQAYCWTAAELQAVLRHAPEGMGDLFDFLRLTGLRVNELCWLTKDDVVNDLPHVKIRAKHCLSSGKSWKPKHGHERIVPLVPEALAIARRAAAASPGLWLFHAPDTCGDQMGRWQKGRVWKAVKAAMKAGGVAAGSPHTFRHVFCSFLAKKNVPPHEIMKVMGHNTMAVALQYCHTGTKELVDAISGVGLGEMLDTTGKGCESSGGGAEPAEI